MDPAGPLFDKDDMSTRLAYTDAEFVDVIHSDVGFGEINFGMEEAIGDVDFYPNGGAWRQPGSSPAPGSKKLRPELRHLL